MEQYKILIWNFRAKRPRKPLFFKTLSSMYQYSNSLVNDTKAEHIEYFEKKDEEWTKIN